MTDAVQLLDDLRGLLRQLETDLRVRCQEIAETDAALKAEYAEAKRVGRTAEAFEVWREEPLTQAAVAWILGTVFVRFLEDNGLIDPVLSGPGDRRRRALDSHTLYFQDHPTETDREYLWHVFKTIGKLPAAGPLFDEGRNPLWRLPISGDAAKTLLEFWQRLDPATGEIAHDLSDASWDTRFLGDLYQDLSESARKRYALLQTPEFVESFILDRTLTPAIETFGYGAVRLIDPTCGSGHFLLGAFARLIDLHQRHEPAVNVRELVQRTLRQVAGVDLNPFALAIARFRLLLAALQACEIRRLADAPGFQFELAVGDSLLHGPRFADDGAVQMPLDPDDPAHHHFAVEDGEAVDRVLGRRYHAVVGNPPYITVKDKALSQLYRQRYGACHMKYSLVVPFVERFFDLALPGQETGHPGHVGLIVGNSFMKREFGRKLIEEYLVSLNLTHIVDTSCAHIPGHGTPTVILLGSHCLPVAKTIRCVMGIRAETIRPADPSRGAVWTEIVTLIDKPDSEGNHVSVADVSRSTTRRHPWSLGGGGASELQTRLDNHGWPTLLQAVSGLGVMAATGHDEIYVFPDQATADRLRIEHTRRMARAENIRDWLLTGYETVVWPYDSKLSVREELTIPRTLQYLWTFRRALTSRRPFGIPLLEKGLRWYEWQELYPDKFAETPTLGGCEVTTHNHFVPVESDVVLKNTIPVVKLPLKGGLAPSRSILAFLNSSLASFWLKQVAHNKGGGGIGGGLATERWEQFYVFNTSSLRNLPVPPLESIASLANEIASLGQEFGQLQPDRWISSRSTAAAAGGVRGQPGADLFEGLRHLRTVRGERHVRLISLQEEMDWRLYAASDLVGEGYTSATAIPLVRLGERSFEVAMARKMATGELQTTWFERHGSEPTVELPDRWPEDYRGLVERRIQLINSDRNVGLIEQPEYKRRWKLEPWDTLQGRALRGWLLSLLEAPSYWPSVELLTTCGGLADVARRDTDFMQVAEVYRGRPDFDVTALVSDLVEGEAVPLLPVQRYKSSGLRKRALWERTWELQRQEDAIDARVDLAQDDPRHLTSALAKKLKAEQVGEIAVPPRYSSKDFQKSGYWRLRGKLDVTKERFVSFPGCERDTDQTPLIAWAGWNHLEVARAVAGYYVRMQEQEGWPAERLVPLLAGLLELLPWVKQWHNLVDPAFGVGMGDYYAGFVDEEARRLGLTLDAIRSWRPEATPGRRRRRVSDASQDDDEGAVES